MRDRASPLSIPVRRVQKLTESSWAQAKRRWTLYVRLTSNGQAGMERVEKFSRTFDEQLCKASGYFLISADFRTP
jgi:hypothetical protein